MTEVVEPAAEPLSPTGNAPSAARPRRRGLRIAAIVLGVLALLVGALYAAVVIAFPPARLAALLADEVRKATGRDFRIDGGLSFQLLPTLAVRAGDVVLRNAEWGSRPEMLRVRRATLEISVQALLHRQLRILKVDVEGVDALLEADEAGHANWQFPSHQTTPAPEPTSEAKTLTLAIDRLVLRDVRVDYRAGPEAQPRTLVLEACDLQVQGEHADVSATFVLERQRWKVDGEVGRIDVLLAGLQDLPFDVRLATDGAALAAKGTLGTGSRAGVLAADVTADLSTTAALMPLGAGVAALPMPLQLRASLRRNGHEVHADPVRLTLAGQTVDGRVTLRMAPPRPKVDMELAAATIDVAKLRPRAPASNPQTPTPAAPNARAALFGDTPLPLTVLPDVELRAVLAVQQLMVPGAPPLSGLKGKITLDPGRLAIDDLQFGMAGGVARGKVALRLGSNSLPRLDLSLDMKAMSVETLARSMRETSELRGGRASLSANLALAGDTPRHLAASANGDVLFSASDVTLVGGAAASLDRSVIAALFQALIPQQSAGKAVVVECAVAGLPLRRGVAAIDRSIGIETGEVAVVASGELNLVDQTVRLEFRPQVKKGLGLSPASLAQLVSLSGPLQNPRTGVDVKGAARGAANVGVAVATGGLTLLAPAARNMTTGSDFAACGGSATSSAAKTAKPATEPKSRPLLFKR